jgi:hypothetical protein
MRGPCRDGLRRAQSHLDLRSGHLLSLLVWLLVLAFSRPGYGGVSVEGQLESVRVEVRDASIQDVVAALNAELGISIRLMKAPDDIINGNFRGPLQRSIGRLLNGRDYVAKYSEGAIEINVIGSDESNSSPPTEAVLAHVATMKYGYQVPLYRQEKMLASQGVDLDRATLALWMGRLAWWLKPPHDVLLDTVLSYPKLFADETPLPVLDPGRGKTKTCRLWVAAMDDRPWGGPAPPAVVTPA